MLPDSDASAATDEIKVLVVDDEAPARARLCRHLAALPGYRCCGEAENADAALEATARLQPDVILLDIRMPGMDGMQLARAIAARARPPAIIFTTADEARALEAFETRALDYLLKPVRRERLAEALDRVQAPAPEETRRLSVRMRGEVQLIELGQVRYFRADSKYVVACLGAEEVLLEESLKSLEQEYGDVFLRVHRNALVARAHVLGLEKTTDGGWILCLADVPLGLEVSRRHLPVVRDWLRRHAPTQG